MKPFKVLLRLEAMEALREVRGAQRPRIAKFIESLAADPFQSGDYSEKDDTQREIQIKVVGQFAITYWADSPVNEVKVTDIRRADRP